MDSYTVAPHLEYFKQPLAAFTTARPEFDSFGVGAYIFSTCSRQDAANTPHILLLQRALTDSMGGCWEGPGGAYEPDTDAILLDGVVREVLEESGLHVSRIVDLVAVDSWMRTRRSDGTKQRIAKYTFIVEVHEAMQQSQAVPYEDIPIRMEASEHQAFEWAVEEDVRLSLTPGQGPYKFPPGLISHQAPNILRAFELFGALQAQTM
ncbi:hypothetical protein N7510_008076 [Penicillium lagena]|uniref:uncharacterized protein n=1 Tax=Penicillium lagena TaxID=94218 RepID=UPI0025425F2A|nr:uncharacterized protein N7510_008076 [Penicillium lagena]KAJ5611357.1 hypothetical protein N7510_008076 [Penicillium lagena]